MTTPCCRTRYVVHAKHGFHANKVLDVAAQFREYDCVKTLLRLAILLTGTISSLRAQGWTGGLKGGFGQGGFTGKSEFTWSATGMNIAMFFSHALTSRVSIQPEILASQKVGQSTVGGSLLTFSGDDINLPVLLRVDYARRAGFTPFLLAGPSVSLHASCSLQFVVAGQVSNIGCDQPSLLSRLDYGVVAGGGVSRAFGPTVVSAELRSNLNLRSIAVPDGSGYGRGIGWAILVGATIPLNGAALRGPKGLPAGAIRMEVLAESQGVFGTTTSDVSHTSNGGSHISLRTSAADARTVLLMLAKQAGVTLRLSSDIRRKVTVSLTDIAAADALHVVIIEAGLSILEQPDASVLHVAAQRHAGGGDK